MLRYFVDQVSGGFVVTDNFTQGKSQVYASRQDAEHVKVWLHSRWLQGRAS